MSKLPTLAACALLAPAITLGISSAIAAESYAGNADAKDQRSTQEQKEMGMTTADREQKQHMSAERAKQHMNTQGAFLSSAPANSFGTDKLIGSELKSRSDDETIGTINELVIDQHGQIAAVIVEAGGFLGLGEKNVAVSWDSIERRSNEDGDGYVYTVNTTKEALEAAPEYKTEANQY